MNSMIDVPGTPYARVIGPLRTERTPFVVGQVSHSHIRGTGIETLRRVTNLEIVAPGKVQREKEPRTLFGWLGRWATGGAGA